MCLNRIIREAVGQRLFIISSWFVSPVLRLGVQLSHLQQAGLSNIATAAKECVIPGFPYRHCQVLDTLRPHLIPAFPRVEQNSLMPTRGVAYA